ncbi:MAG: hypothetical protein IKW39_03850 [Alphaproteobacteria bacterium]|nr:hypothetical protein [Alphaproteobacteria bacterium]
MRMEVKDFFKNIDSGRYDTVDDAKYIAKNREYMKKGMIRVVSVLNPYL